MTTSQHIKIKFKGNENRIVFLNDLLRYLDADWPYGDGLTCTGTKRTLPFDVCGVCGGMVYNRPALSQAEIEAAGKQCSVGVKIKMWQDEDRCKVCGVGV